MSGTRRKQQRPGIAKNDKNNGTIKTTNKPTKPHSNSQRTALQTCAPNIRRTTHISQHSTLINTPVTTHQQYPASGPRSSKAKTNCPQQTAPILHTPVQARQALNHHAVACTQHRRHAEHSQKACMVQKANEQGTPFPPPPPPLYREGTARRPVESGRGEATPPRRGKGGGVPPVGHKHQRGSPER